MVTVYYYHVDRKVEYYKEFEEVKKAKQFYLKVKHVKYYIVSYSCQTDYELKVMENVIK